MLRDSTGVVVGCWSKWIYGSFCSRIVEALCLKKVLSWLYTRQQENVLIEMDSKGVVDALHGSHSDLPHLVASFRIAIFSFVRLLMLLLVLFIYKLMTLLMLWLRHPI